MAMRAHVELTAGGQRVGWLRDCRVDVQAEALPAAAVDAYGWAYSVPGLRRWSASGSVFVPAGGADPGQAAVRDALAGRTTVAVSVAYADGSEEEGEAVVAGWEVSGAVGGVVEGSFELTGVGPLV